MRICPVYGNEFVRDRPLWLYAAYYFFMGMLMLVMTLLFMSEPEQFTQGGMSESERDQLIEMGMKAEEIHEIEQAARIEAESISVFLGLATGVFLCAWACLILQPYRWVWWVDFVLQWLSYALNITSLPWLLFIGTLGLMESVFSLLDLAIAAVILYWWWQRKDCYSERATKVAS